MKGLNQKNHENNPFLESILAIGIATVYMLIAIYFFPIIGILFTIPFIILGIRNHMKYNIASIIISTLLIGIFTDKATGFFILLAFAPISVVLNYSIKKRNNSQQTMFLTTIAALISYIIVIVLLGRVTGTSFIKQLEESFSQVLKYQINLLKDMERTSYEIYESTDVLESLYEYIILMVPSTIIMVSMLTAYLNSIISISILRKIGYGIVGVPKFSYLKLPNNIIMGTISIYLGVFILKFLDVFYHETIFMNITLLISFFFFLEGLAVIIFYLNKSRLNKIFRWILILFIIITVPLSAIISIIGFLDIIFDFRRIRRKI